MRNFIPPQPPSQPPATEIPAGSLDLPAPQPSFNLTPSSINTSTSTATSTDINADLPTNECPKRGLNLDDYRPPRRNSPQYELASHFSAIQVDDELDPEKDDFVIPEIPDVLAMRRERWANNVAMVHRTARQRKKDNLPKARPFTPGTQLVFEEDDIAVDDSMDLGEDEIEINFRSAERVAGDRARICKKKQMRKRKRDKERGGKRDRDKKAKVAAAASQADGSGGLPVPVAAAPQVSDGSGGLLVPVAAASQVSDGQHDHPYGYVHPSSYQLPP